MEKYPRLFIQMSLIYLFIGMCVGVLRAFGVGTRPDMVFQHVHYNLLGFMTMIVSGIGYFIVPRFNGTVLYFPRWVAIHFWGANAGLVFMVTGFHLKHLGGYDQYGAGRFHAGVGLSALGIALFTINLFLTIQFRNRNNQGTVASEIPPPPPIQKAKPVEKPSPPVKWSRILPTDKVTDITDQYPGTLEILVEMGLTPLGSPEHLDRVREIGIPLGSACMNHGIDLEMIIGKLEEHINSNNPVTKTSTSKAKSNSLPVETTSSTDVIAGQITQSMIIGDVLGKYPETRNVFMKYYGAGCFSCPGQATETIKQSAMMHTVDINRLIEELNQAI